MWYSIRENLCWTASRMLCKRFICVVWSVTTEGLTKFVNRRKYLTLFQISWTLVKSGTTLWSLRCSFEHLQPHVNGVQIFGSSWRLIFVTQLDVYLSNSYLGSLGERQSCSFAHLFVSVYLQKCLEEKWALVIIYSAHAGYDDEASYEKISDDGTR